VKIIGCHQQSGVVAGNTEVEFELSEKEGKELKAALEVVGRYEGAALREAGLSRKNADWTMLEPGQAPTAGGSFTFTIQQGIVDNSNEQV